jgi:hypothetical protein
MLIKLCVGNYASHNDLFNGVNEVFQYVSKLHDNESLIWIAFNNPKVGFTTRSQNQHLYPTNIQNIGHQYNQFLKRYKCVLIQAM